MHSHLSEPLTRHLDADTLPSRDAVIALVKQLRELLFPGYFGKQPVCLSRLEYTLGEHLSEIEVRLREQVTRALHHYAARHDRAVPEGTAQELVHSFLSRLPDVRALLATDVKAAFEGDPAAADTDEIIFSYPGIFAITVHRLAHELHRLEVPLIPRIMSEYAHSVTGVDIHPGATLGEGFFIDHGTGVVIGETAVIGDRVKIYQGVTLGALSTRGGQSLRGIKRHPTLMDEVTVYSGASILGGDTIIGEGAVIASNVFITQSVPAHTRVSATSPELHFRER
ncbi:MAG: serine acetyltransferase [Firmicutes bacterium]|nr:serine acetyltransferase [Bacillota bacterium]